MSTRKPPPRRPAPPLDDDDELTQFANLDDEGNADAALPQDGLGEELEGSLGEELLLADAEEEKTVTVFPHSHDTFEDSMLTLDPRRTLQPMYSAPEVTQTAWQERNFAPRGTMPPDQVMARLDRALKIAGVQRGTLDRTRSALKAEWLPLLRQTVEQAGGDGLDCYLSMLRGGPRKTPRDALVAELGTLVDRVNRSKDLPSLMVDGKRVVSAAKKALLSPAPRKLSVQYLEEKLEGRMEVDAVLSILFSSQYELEQKLLQTTRTLESLRDQLKAMPGGSPDALFRNFSRLKLERQLIEGEQERRRPRVPAPVAPPPPPPSGFPRKK